MATLKEPIFPADASRPNSAGEEPEHLGALLKRCRARIGSGCAALGVYLRLPSRIGKAVTQEEIAEAAGITREWYARMEGDRPVRISARTVAQIADVLMMNHHERATLFGLAIPEFRSASLTESSQEVLDAFGSLRRLTRPLLVATTEAEALTVIREYAMTQLGPDTMVTFIRAGEGAWEYTAIGEQRNGDQVQIYQDRILERWGAAAFDDIMSYTLITQAGELITRSQRNAYLPVNLVEEDRLLQEAIQRPEASFAMANIRSQHGFIGRVMLLYSKAHSFSELERAQLSTYAELVSFALSGGVSR